MRDVDLFTDNVVDGRNCGHTIGGDTLEVTGSFVQQSGSTLRFRAADDNNWGKLQVDGNAYLSCVVYVDLVGSYNPAVGFTKRVVTTNGGLSGSASTDPFSGWTALTGVNYLDLLRTAGGISVGGA
jgi:hypothetical protein